MQLDLINKYLSIFQHFKLPYKSQNRQVNSTVAVAVAVLAEVE